jgi:hypothetical protein
MTYDVLGADGERLGVPASLGITLDEWVQGRLGGARSASPKPSAIGL